MDTHRAPCLRTQPAIIVLLVLAGLLSSSAAPAQTVVPAPAPTPPDAAAPPPTAQSQEEWRATMSRTPLPKTGCFTSAYPRTEWKEVPCATPLPRPYPPASGPRPQTVGSGTDWTAKSNTLKISTAIGSFDSVSGVTSVTDSRTNNADTFSLQISTNPFLTLACNNFAATCRGWQQFVFSTHGCTGNQPCALIEYWLYNIGSHNCPSGWHSYGPPNSCYQNSQGAIVPAQKIADLANMILTGTAEGGIIPGGGGTDTVTMSVGDPPQLYKFPSPDILDLGFGLNWNETEFNIFGDCCGSQANFNPGSTLIVRTSLNEGANIAPTCVQAGFTAETNNLTLVGTPTVVPATKLPAIVFTESNVSGGTPASCAASQGDTHLTTFNGLHYDFQASGDFLLAETGSDFVVQTRQVSGAPRWPNASVNRAVATKMGKTTIAVCVGPTRLVVDGKLRSLGDGKSLSLAEATVSRSGNVYLIKRKNGDSVRAQLNHVADPSNDWIDVSVGLGDGSQAPKVRGLLGNPNGNINEIALRDGTVLPKPVSFEDLYHRYGDSWRVPPAQSLLCRDRVVKSGNPAKPFYANDLNPEQYERARAICSKAGIKESSALDDCALDVTVLGSGRAASVFVHAPTPIAVVQAGARSR